MEVWKEIAGKAAAVLSLITDSDKIIKDSPSLRAQTVRRLTFRIFRNLLAIHKLAVCAASMTDGTIYLKLPVGLLLRNCLIDSILMLYVAIGDEESASRFNELSNWKYVEALFEEFEVYRDKVSDIFPDEEYCESVYTSQLEDHYLSELDFNERTTHVEPLKTRHIWKPRSYKELYEDCRKNDIDLKKIKEKLLENGDTADCAASLYAYYKYFSQYEHYSERGDGDSRAPFGEDNIKIVKTFSHLLSVLRIAEKNCK